MGGPTAHWHASRRQALTDSPANPPGVDSLALGFRVVFEDVLKPVQKELREVNGKLQELSERVDTLEARLEDSVLKLNNHAAVSEFWTQFLITRLDSSTAASTLVSDTFGAARSGSTFDEIREMIASRVAESEASEASQEGTP